MKTASLITVGTEIMRGKMDDTNSTFLSRYLKERGIRVRYRASVEDSIEDIEWAIRTGEGSDLIFLTGGLGPTTDDLTREGLAKYLGKNLTFVPGQWEILVDFFKRFNRYPSDSNRQQAFLIEGGEFLKNDNGTAPGMSYYQDGKLFILLPGPPPENQPMLIHEVDPLLKKRGFLEGDLFTKIVRIYNVGESIIGELFKDFSEDVHLGYYISARGWVELHFSKFIRDQKEIPQIESICARGLKILETQGLFYTGDEDLSFLVLQKLLEKKQTLALAESVTGGNVSGEFVKNPGASQVFIGGVVSYSNKMKKDILEVTAQSLEKYGAVSAQVVSEMVAGLKKKTGAHICVALSGIAGPEGGSPEKPVGLVHMGFLFGDELVLKKEVFGGSREQILNRCVHYVFTEILRKISRD